ncbi:MAG: hypothetical protein CL840_20535 [Crocinitomicaceae bacterium]|nr:hypothetical protein [Crocinitomicaceae bacterium]|tara:strand:- start:1903 stop:3354 length:1452 start_codon:yes stop_codon:yes gene_type:complete
MKVILYASRIIIILLIVGVGLWFWDSYSIAKTKQAAESNLALEEIKHNIQNNSQCYNLIKQVHFDSRDRLYMVKTSNNGSIDTISSYTGVAGGHTKEFPNNAIDFYNESKVDINMRVALQPSESYYQKKAPISWVDSSLMSSIVDTSRKFVIGDTNSIQKFIETSYQSKGIAVTGWQVEDNTGKVIYSKPAHLAASETLDEVILFSDFTYQANGSYLLRVETDKNQLIWSWVKKWEFLLALGFIALCALLLFSVERNVRKEKRLNESQQAMLNHVSHEINTQVAKILLSVERIKDNSEEAKQHPYFNIIEKASNGLSNGLNSFLVSGGIDAKAYSRGKTDVNVKTILEEVIQNINPKAKSLNKVLETNLDNLLHVRFNPTHLTQVLSNIIDNAVKYGGNKIKIATRKNGKSALIRISDNGKGLDPKYLKQIFDPYFRMDATQANGFGVGLSYCKAVIKANSGKIYAENLPDGNGFMIQLEINR